MSNNNPTTYKGRFAPSPTGAVHYGTLVAAVGSYLQAKKNNGEWIIRMEDVDTTRRVKGSDSEILKTLEAFGFQWQGEIVYQSQRTELYKHALEQLISQKLIFPCLCSRKQLVKIDSSIYPGTCRSRLPPETNPHALRIHANDIDITFNDYVMGRQTQNIKHECGDFIIKRRDGLFAYQLAVVVDDALQGITEVVRGADLLSSTNRQIYLQQQLNYATPLYCHLPLAVDKKGNKISKSAGTARVDIRHKEKLLISVFTFLGQPVPNDLEKSSLDDIWKWAIQNWDVQLVTQENTILLTSFD
jgi:glutamyl-Q tRNA(Asp) synthetase